MLEEKYNTDIMVLSGERGNLIQGPTMLLLFIQQCYLPVPYN